MRRFRSRGFRRSRSGRRTRWCPFLWQGSGTFESAVNAANVTWVSFWAKWPSQFVNPSGLTVGTGVMEPSEETVVRYVGNINVFLDPAALVPGSISPVSCVAGLIAFDGGSEPAFYEDAAFDSASFVSPPNPCIYNADDDWLIRIPFEFTASQQIQNPADRIFLESKAKRKLPPGMGILAVLGMVDLLADDTQTHGLSWSWDGRLAVRTGYTV